MYKLVASRINEAVADLHACSEMLFKKDISIYFDTFPFRKSDKSNIRYTVGFRRVNLLLFVLYNCMLKITIL